MDVILAGYLEEIALLFEIETPPDFSFRETLLAHGWRSLAPFYWSEETQALIRVEQLEDGLTTRLTITEGQHCLRIETSHIVEVEKLIPRVETMFQLNLPLTRFYDFCGQRSELHLIPTRKQGRMLCSPTLWEDCCKVILTTNTTWSQSVAMTKRFVQAYGSPLDTSPAEKAFPTPEAVAEVPFAAFESTARFGYRNQSVHTLATAIAEGSLDLEQLRDNRLTSAEVWKQLLKIRGVGPYAASCLMIYMGRYERVNVDSWARMLVGRQVGNTVTDREVHQFFEPYGEWSGIVYHFYPWRADEPLEVST